MTPGQLAQSQSVQLVPEQTATLIKWQVVCCRTREPLTDPMFSKQYAETLAEKHTKKGRAAIVDRVEV